MSGENDVEYFENSRKAWKLFKIKVYVWFFFKKNSVDKVFYIGCTVNMNGMFPVKEKLDVIKNFEEPKTVSKF